VVLSTLNQVPLDVNTNLLILFSSKSVPFDCKRNLLVSATESNPLIDYKETWLPIYGRLARLRGQGFPLLYDHSNSDPVALEILEPRFKVLRVGYDLFHEIAFLFSEGQPIEYAQIPTLEYHISMLRNWILDAGIPVVEIPPVPGRHRFFACLTHDVDFVGIRNHRFDHTMWGFIHRALVGSCKGFLKGTCSFEKLVRNWIAVFSLPLIYLGVLDDFWDRFNAYSELEEGLCSTFFLIPFKDRAGDNLQGKYRARRAARYDIGDVRKQAQNLTSRGFEISLHGIDAWHSAEKGKKELERIAETTGQKDIGVRMHWLSYDRDSPVILDQAGFEYDSTLGYNETIGFKVGTTQVFQPLEVNHLLELPLNIQDTALFFPGRMALNDVQAWALCQSILATVELFGGIVTILWHMRSLAPERLWGDFYDRLLQELLDRGAWFGTANQVTQWFRRRRSVNFEEVRFEKHTLKLQLKCEDYQADVPLILRVHQHRKDGSVKSIIEESYIDIPWSGESCIEISLA